MQVRVATATVPPPVGERNMFEKFGGEDATMKEGLKSEGGVWCKLRVLFCCVILFGVFVCVCVFLLLFCFVRLETCKVTLWQKHCRRDNVDNYVRELAGYSVGIEVIFEILKEG